MSRDSQCGVSTLPPREGSIQKIIEVMNMSYGGAQLKCDLCQWIKIYINALPRIIVGP